MLVAPSFEDYLKLTYKLYLYVGTRIAYGVDILIIAVVAGNAQMSRGTHRDIIYLFIKFQRCL